MHVAESVTQQVAAYLSRVAQEVDAELAASDDDTKHAYAFGRLRAAVEMAVRDLRVTA